MLAFTGVVAPSNALFVYFIVTADEAFKQLAEALNTFIAQFITVKTEFAETPCPEALFQSFIIVQFFKLP
jgi:hypothetical protein